MNLYNTIATENQRKKTENKEIKEFFYLNIQLNGLGTDFTACKGELVAEVTLASFTARDAYCHFAGQA